MKVAGLIVATVFVVAPLAAAAQPKPGSDFSSISNAQPAWSPDGGEIAFTSTASGHSQIYAIDPIRRRVRRVTHDSATSELNPKWLLDGRIVFHGIDENRPFVGYVDPHGRTVKLPGLKGDPDWSPDAKWIVFDRDDGTLRQHQIWVAKADGSDARLIVANAGANGGFPDWSPDGKRIAFVAGGDPNHTTLQVIDADGGGRLGLTDGSTPALWPDWSPNGQKIAYNVGRTSANQRLAVVNADGSGPRTFFGTGSDDYLPAWSPDGRRIAFTSSSDNRHDEIWVMGADGRNVRRVTYGGCTVIGTTNAEMLYGTPGRDVICGFAGDDVLHGFGGSDRLLSGPGNDTLDGGTGNDRLFGEQGNDVLRAGPGSDVLDGGSGRDTGYVGAHDIVHSIELAKPTARATGAQLEAGAKEAVQASRAKLVSVEINPPRAYRLTVAVRDPAAYLHHRVNTLLSVVNEERNLEHWRFAVFVFVVGEPYHGIALRYTDRSERITAYVRPGLLGCVEYIDLDIETADYNGPGCPA
jgi:Tol biopolymer transport system component